MIFKFRLISNEVKDFVRDFELLSDQSFFDFHRAIIKELHYDKSQITSFFLAGNSWERLQEFALFDLSEGKSPNHIPMDQALLKDYLSRPKQRLLYVFDYFNDRVLKIELTEISPRQEKGGYPRVTFSRGHAPAQILEDMDITGGADADE
jgi:hypothetical protein